MNFLARIFGNKSDSDCCQIEIKEIGDLEEDCCGSEEVKVDVSYSSAEAQNDSWCR